MVLGDAWSTWSPFASSRGSPGCQPRILLSAILGRAAPLASCTHPRASPGITAPHSSHLCQRVCPARTHLVHTTPHACTSATSHTPTVPTSHAAREARPYAPHPAPERTPQACCTHLSHAPCTLTHPQRAPALREQAAHTAHTRCTHLTPHIMLSPSPQVRAPLLWASICQGVVFPSPACMTPTPGTAPAPPSEPC